MGLICWLFLRWLYVVWGRGFEVVCVLLFWLFNGDLVVGLAVRLKLANNVNLRRKTGKGAGGFRWYFGSDLVGVFVLIFADLVWGFDFTVVCRGDRLVFAGEGENEWGFWVAGAWPEFGVVAAGE
ncbi:hypothetical protein KY285_036089 [Solanum tuberosum]|nr:hypothetical protein KY289_036252 [Solanum tuberosum]KAH0639503.1 hypothetical protein KY285_036089 [Solanum tuberosum]KAH0680869.1 hypothetical protein KY284_021954 [Solanum tuberosum]